MSDECLLSPELTDDSVDECAPTEREPSLLGATMPSHGAALSVLWWLDGDDADAEQPGPSEASDHARD